MEISVFFDHILEGVNQTGLTVPVFLQKVKSYGITALEINCGYLRDNPEVFEMIKESGLKISCIYETHDFYNSDSFESAKEHVDLAAKTGSRKILVIPGYLPQKEAELFSDCSDYDETAKRMENNPSLVRTAKLLKKTVDYAKDKMVSVTLEDYDGFTSPCSHTNQLLWFMKNAEGLKFTFDTGNFAYSNEDNKKAFEVLKDYIVHVHCKDRGVENSKKPLQFNRGLACVPVGDGYMNIDYFLKLLQTYKGYFAIEHFGAPDQLLYIKKSADFILNSLSSR